MISNNELEDQENTPNDDHEISQNNAEISKTDECINSYQNNYHSNER